MSVEREMASQSDEDWDRHRSLKYLRRNVEEGIVKPSELSSAERKALGICSQEERLNPLDHCHG